MKRRIFQALLFCLLFIIGGVFNIRTISAASVDIEITGDGSEITVGDTVYVYINIASDAVFTDVEANLTYDEDILEYKSGILTGGSGFLKLSDINLSEGSDNRKYAMEFEALKAGKSEIEFTGSIMVYDNESGLPMSVSSKSLEIDVKAAHTASENANLKSLKISPTDLSPAFDKNTLVYNTNVGYDTTKLVVVALPEDEKATVRVSGNDLLEEGDNKVVISVTAESGNVIEYTINAVRENAPKEGVDTEPITPDKKHGSLDVIRSGEETFVIYNGKYKLVEPSADVKVPSGYAKTKTIISDISIQVYAPEQLDTEFLLIYAENELGEAGFYRYDRVEKTMQRYKQELVPVYDPVDDIDKDSSSNEYRSNLNKAAIIIAILSALCALFLILFVRCYIKLRGYGNSKK